MSYVALAVKKSLYDACFRRVLKIKIKSIACSLMDFPSDKASYNIINIYKGLQKCKHLSFQPEYFVGLLNHKILLTRKFTL